MKIIVIGTGYVGLVQGAGLASLGHDVVCVDVDVAKIEKLRIGEIPFFEIGLSDLVKQGFDAGRLQFSTTLVDAFKVGPQVIFIAVGTPSDEKGNADLKFVEAVARELGQVVTGPMVIVEKSTVPVGTGLKIKDWIGRADVTIASNPEFLREGSAVADFMKPDRIVLGVDSDAARDLLLEVYAGIEAPKLVMNRESAELAKYAANTMLASRLSLMNELANIADVVGANILEVEKVLASDPRIGAKFLRSGAGFGGSCFPKDVLALESTARLAGYEPRLIAPIIDVNNDQPIRFAEKIEKRLGGLSGKKLAVWGLAFNKGTDDVRESPAIKIIYELLRRGASVSAFDPAAKERAQAELGDLINYAASSFDVLNEADALCVLTEWPEFISADWTAVKNLLKTPLIFDGKNCLPHDHLSDLEVEVIGMGVWHQPSSRQ